MVTFICVIVVASMDMCNVQFNCFYLEETLTWRPLCHMELLSLRVPELLGSCKRPFADALLAACELLSIFLVSPKDMDSLSVLYIHAIVYVYIYKEEERGREGDRQREREREKERKKNFGRGWYRVSITSSICLF